MRYLILFVLLASPVLAHPHHECKPNDPHCEHGHPDKDAGK